MCNLRDCILNVPISDSRCCMPLFFSIATSSRHYALFMLSYLFIKHLLVIPEHRLTVCHSTFIGFIILVKGSLCQYNLLPFITIGVSIQSRILIRVRILCMILI